VKAHAAMNSCHRHISCWTANKKKSLCRKIGDFIPCSTETKASSTMTQMMKASCSRNWYSLFGIATTMSLFPPFWHDKMLKLEQKRPLH